MIDYGTAALLVVVVALAGLAYAEWRRGRVLVGVAARLRADLRSSKLRVNHLESANAELTSKVVGLTDMFADFFVVDASGGQSGVED